MRLRDRLADRAWLWLARQSTYQTRRPEHGRWRPIADVQVGWWIRWRDQWRCVAGVRRPVSLGDGTMLVRLAGDDEWQRYPEFSRVFAMTPGEHTAANVGR